VLYLVSGKEELLRDEFVGQLKALMRKLPMGEHNIDELGQGASLRDVTTACDNVPFLCEKRMVIARGLVSQAGRSRGRGRRATATAATPLDELLEYLPRLPASTHLVIVEDDASSLQPLASVRGDAVKRDFPRLRDDALPRWIVDRTGRHETRISPRAAAELAQLVGSDLRALDSELAKLASFVDAGATVEVADVRELVAGAGPDIFALHDAVAERRPAAALAAAHGLMERGDEPAEMLAQLAALVRRLLVVKELVAEHRQLSRDAPALGLTSSPFALQKLQRQAARISSADLERSYALLCGADLAMKTGRMDSELIVELAVAGLVGLLRADATAPWSQPAGPPHAASFAPVP
jgi:DNA polymerase-3 subunit delta